MLQTVDVTKCYNYVLLQMLNVTTTLCYNRLQPHLVTKWCKQSLLQNCITPPCYLMVQPLTRNSTNNHWLQMLQPLVVTNVTSTRCYKCYIHSLLQMLHPLVLTNVTTTRCYKCYIHSLLQILHPLVVTNVTTTRYKCYNHSLLQMLQPLVTNVTSTRCDKCYIHSLLQMLQP